LISKEDMAVSTTSILLEQYKIAENRRTSFGHQFMQTTGFVIALFAASVGLIGIKSAALLRLTCIVGGAMFLAMALLGYRLGRRQDDCERTLAEVEDALLALGHLGIVRLRKAARFGARNIIAILMGGFGILLLTAAVTGFWMR